MNRKTTTGRYPGHRGARPYELFRELKKLTVESDKIEFLHEFVNATPLNKESMHIMTYLLTNPAAVFELPYGAPEYNPNNAFPDNCKNLSILLRKVGYFLLNNDQKLKSAFKREMIFARWLETVQAGDAEVLIAIKDRDFDFLGVDFPLLRKAFPNWTPEDYTEPERPRDTNTSVLSAAEIKRNQEILLKTLEKEILEPLNSSGTEVGKPITQKIKNPDDLKILEKGEGDYSVATEDDPKVPEPQPEPVKVTKKKRGRKPKNTDPKSIPNA